MFSVFEISNYRCFEKIRLENLSRVNIITGPNNIGKTTLLEAIWSQQAPKSPDISFRANKFRKFYGIKLNRPLEEVFYNFDYRKEIIIFSEKYNGEKRKFTMKSIPRRYSRQLVQSPESNIITIPSEDEYTSEAEENDVFSDIETFDLEVSYVFENDKTEEYSSLIRFREDGRINFERIEKTLPTSIIMPIDEPESADLIKRYSELVRKRQKSKIINFLQLIEPRLVDLEVGLLGGIPNISGDIGLSEFLPIPLLGDGINRLLRMIVNIGSAKHGSVLIDEIGRGIYFKHLPTVWEAIIKFAKEMDTQLFTTTHSKECIEAAFNVFERDYPKDLTSYHLYRKNGKTKVSAYDIEALEGALKTGMEVR